MAPLKGKVALVTGAGQGLGRGIGLALARAGAAVGLVGRTRETLDDTAELIRADGGQAYVASGDVSVRASVDAAVADIAATLGPVWVLVNNAMSTDDKPLEEVDDAALDVVLRTGVYGSLYMMQACFPDMRRLGGRIVNFGSGAATAALPEVAAYVIAKEGIRGLTKTAAVGWGKYGITVNTICPMVFTPMFDKWWDARTVTERENHMNAIPMRRMGDAQDDVGALVVFLAGPGGSYITSRTLHVDGGRWCYDR